VYSHPPFRRTYFQALNEAANGPLLEANAGLVMDALDAACSANGVAVQSPASVKSWISSRRTYILQQLASATANFAISSNGGQEFSTTNDTVVLTGTAPLAVRSLTVNGVPLPAAWTTVTGWAVEVPLQRGRNRLVAQGFDWQGNLVASATILVTSTAPVTVLPRIRINEWMASNGHTLVDPADLPNLRYQDWFELHNAGATPVDLSGYTLSDTRENLALSIIPEGTTIAPGGFLLVWADEEPWQNRPGGNLHVNFKLDIDGDSILLADPDGRIVDEVTFGRQARRRQQQPRARHPRPLPGDPAAGVPSRLGTTLPRRDADQPRALGDAGDHPRGTAHLHRLANAARGALRSRAGSTGAGERGGILRRTAQP